MNLLRTCKKISTILNSFFAINKALRIQNSKIIGVEEFRILTDDATNLRILKTSECSWMSDDLLGPVLKNNQKLNDLDLSQSLNCSSSVFQVCFNWKLVSIQCKDIFFKILTVNCTQITRLVLQDCPWVDHSSLNYFSNHYSIRKPGQQMEDVLLNMSKGLRTDLKAKTKSKYRGKDQLYDVMKRKGESRKGRSTKRFMNLLELDLNGCHRVTDDNIETLALVFKHLEILRLGSMSAITDTAMKSIAIHLKQLHTLDIRSIHIKTSIRSTFPVLVLVPMSQTPEL